jgi:hypothetical protein
MPISNREMSEFMGAAYIPGTFPTVGVYARMTQAGVKTSWAEVDRLWDAYYLALSEEKIPPYGKAASGAVKAKLLNSMAARTSLSKNTVAAWLNALVDEVNDNGRDYYLDPVTADAAAVGKFDPVNHPLETLKTLTKATGEAAGSLLKPSADALTNVIKYAAIGLVSAALIYGVYQGVTIYKATKKRKRG